MKANKVIEQLDSIRPNPYSDEQKLGWINNLEEMVQRLVIQSTVINTLSYPEDMDKELIITAPFDNLYQMYLESMIDYYNREYGNYNNSVIMFEKRFTEYKKAYIRGNSVGSGKDGATFIPHVSADGVLSWTNNKGLPNPAPVNLKVNNGGGATTTPKTTLTQISILASKWAGEHSPYSQIVKVAGVTQYSKVDLQPSVEQLAIFHEKDLAFVTENENGVVTVYAIGDKPQNDYTMQATITEVVV